MGVVVRRYIDIFIIIMTFPYSICISFFLTAASLLLYSFLMFFHFCSCYFCAIIIANVAHRTFKIIQKSRSSEDGDIINYTDKNIECMSTARV